MHFSIENFTESGKITKSKPRVSVKMGAISKEDKIFKNENYLMASMIILPASSNLGILRDLIADYFL